MARVTATEAMELTALMRKMISRILDLVVFMER